MDHLLAFGGKLIQFSVKESAKTKKTSIEARILSLSDGKGEWENESDVILELNEKQTSTSVNILQTRNCLEIKTGFLLPIIVLQVSSARDPVNNQLFLVGLNLSEGSLIPLQNVDQSDIKTLCDNHCVSLTTIDGPIISWIKHDQHFICAPDNESPCQSSPTTLPLNFKPNSILGSRFSCGKYIFVTSHKGQHAKAYSVSFSPLRCKNITIRHFYPEEFTNITKIHFVDVKLSSNLADDITEIADDNTEINIWTSLYAITDEGYILHFRDGQLMFAIPVDDVRISCDAETHVFSPFGLTKTLVVVHSNDNVFLVDADEKQVINNWTEVQSCYCEDFVGLGRPQLLILKKDFTTSSGWLLTDTFSVHIDRLQGEEPANTHAVEKHKDSTSAAVHALRTRLTNDLVNLGEKRREVTCKESFISSTWQTLQGNLQGRSLCHASKDPTLITMLNKREGQSLTGRTPKVEIRHNRAVIHEIWQRVLTGHWVVGVECSANKTMSFQVVLVPENGEKSYSGCITCSSKQFCDETSRLRTNQKPGNANEEVAVVNNPQKKRRLSESRPDEELSPLTKHFPACVATLPKFGRSKKICCRVLLQWTDDDDGELPTGRQDCGIICLAVEAVLQNRYSLKGETTTKESLRDLLALSLTQLEVCLKLEGTHPVSPGRLKEWLEERAKFTYRPVYKCYMSDVTSLHLVRITISEAAAGDGQSARFTLSARDAEQMALTLHHLYSCFPDNVLILPDNQQVMSKSLKHAVGNLEKELRFLTSAMKDFSKGNHSSIQEMQTEHEKSADGLVDVERVRANFAKRKRDLLHSSDSELVSVDDTEQYRKQLEELQLNTDTSMIDLVRL